jgi:hypothetical protein
MDQEVRILPTARKESEPGSELVEPPVRARRAGPVLAALRAAGRVAFVFTEVFTFTGDRISRLETFHINVGGPGDTLFTAPAG